MKIRHGRAAVDRVKRPLQALDVNFEIGVFVFKLVDLVDPLLAVLIDRLADLSLDGLRVDAEQVRLQAIP